MKRIKLTSVPIIVVVPAALFYLAALVVHAVFADDDPPKTTLTQCSGSLPSLSLLGNSDCSEVVITATETHRAQLIGYWPQEFSHEFYHAGDPACVFTAKAVWRHGLPTWPAPGTIASGRDCRPGLTQCAFIAEGYATFAVTGQSCTEAGIPLCGGPFCV